jgi:hypothetical protein
MRLDAADTADVDRLARTLCGREHDQVAAPEWVSRARRAWDALPLALRREVRGA